MSSSDDGAFIARFFPEKKVKLDVIGFYGTKKPK